MRTKATGRAIAQLAALLFASAVAAAPQTKGAIESALGDPGRPDADRAKDAARHPAELLTLLGISAGDTIADIWPGVYWDRLFSDLVGPAGKVYAVHFVEGDKDDKIVTPRAGSMPLQGHENVEVVVSHPNTFTLPTKADVIWIRQNYHDLYNPFMGPANVAAFNKSVFDSLRRGGRYVIIDHVAPKGSRLQATNTTHRIDPDVVRADAARAGFQLVGESGALRNPADPLTAVVFDGAIRGHTDQFVYVFKRP